MRARTGFSLIEVIIAAGMATLLLGGVYALLTGGNRYARETEATADAQTQAANVVRVLCNEMSSSVDHWTIMGPEPGAFVRFLSPRPPQGGSGTIDFDPNTGKLVWKKWVCYWHEASDNTLMRAEIPLTPPTSQLTTEPLPSGLMLPGFQSAPAGQKRIVAHGVQKFTVGGAGPGVAVYDVSITTKSDAAVAASADSNKLANVTLATRITMVNHDP